MRKYFEVAVKYTKEMPTGVLARVTEPFLIQADTFGHAEEKMYEQFGSTVKGELIVTKISPSKVQDVITAKDDEHVEEYPLFKVNWSHQSLDCDSDKPKVINNVLMIAAQNMDQAQIAAQQYVDTYSHSDAKIKAVSETKMYFLVLEENPEKETETDTDPLGDAA